MTQEVRQWRRTCSIGPARRALYAALRRFWHPVLWADELGDRPVAARLLDEPLVLVRLDGEVRAFRDLCVHRGTALSLGWVEDGCLVCAVPRLDVRRGRRLHADPGQPRDEHPEQGPDLALRRGRARRADLGLPRRRRARRCRCPRFPEWADDAYRKIKIPQYDWHCSAARRVENFVDFSHFAWVHEGILGDRSKPEIPDHDVVRDATTLWFELGIEEPANDLKGDAGDAGPDPARAEPVHDLDAVHGAPRPAAGGRPPLRAVRRVVPAVGQGDPQLHLERAQLRPRPGRATRASSTSSR